MISPRPVAVPTTAQAFAVAMPLPHSARATPQMSPQISPQGSAVPSPAPGRPLLASHALPFAVATATASNSRPLSPPTVRATSRVSSPGPSGHTAPLVLTSMPGTPGLSAARAPRPGLLTVGAAPLMRSTTSSSMGSLASWTMPPPVVHTTGPPLAAPSLTPSLDRAASRGSLAMAAGAVSSASHPPLSQQWNAPVISPAISKGGSTATVEPIAAPMKTTSESATVSALRSEVVELRHELAELQNMLSEGLQQRDEAEMSRRDTSNRLEKLERRRADAETRLKEANNESKRLREELAKLQGETLLPPSRSSRNPSPERSQDHGSDVGNSRDSRRPASSRLQHNDSQTSFGLSEDGRDSYRQQPPLPPPSIASRADGIDELWCEALRQFPEHKDWILVKEKHGVYRMGGPYGRRIMCRVAAGRLQVRVGGGWVPAVQFLERHGPAGMNSSNARADGHETPTSTGLRQTSPSMMDTPPSLERLLVPTRSWANKIGM
eukprot:TRINITY_DN121590_c0_g1_i1.p1 TRINITY_DN121590_c0_g1~~TRINITY_DN121590_c0_g1_i1.p1  ORF type:complete len:494 (+),score=70.46 TRINITY_DN121590_c0_g1_i1:141-1622(+)